MDIVQVFDTVWYTPNVSGNRESPFEKRMRVQIRPLAARAVRMLDDSVSTIAPGQSPESINWVERFSSLRNSAILGAVTQVENLSVVEVRDGQHNRRKITTAKDLVDLAFEPLLQDIYAAIRDHSILLEGVLGK